MPADNCNETFSREPLHGLAHSRTADTDALAQHHLGPQAAGRQLERDDKFLELAVGYIGQAIVALCAWPEAGIAVGGPWWRAQVSGPDSGARLTVDFFAVMSSVPDMASLLSSRTAN